MVRGKIAEVFRSVQGEGIYLGEEQIFARFYGCNLKCQFCDTRLDHFAEYEPKELFKEIKLYGNQYHSVAFTGGEPLLQKNFLRETLKLTHQAGYKNYLETNGTLHNELEEVIDDVDIVAMDLKLPSSTGLSDFWHLHRRTLKAAAQKEVFLKMVICNSTKEEDLVEGLNLIREIDPFLILVLQPNSGEGYEPLKDKLERFRDVSRDHRITACIIPQVHKEIGIK